MPLAAADSADDAIPGKGWVPIGSRGQARTREFGIEKFRSVVACGGAGGGGEKGHSEREKGLANTRARQDRFQQTISDILFFPFSRNSGFVQAHISFPLTGRGLVDGSPTPGGSPQKPRPQVVGPRLPIPLRNFL